MSRYQNGKPIRILLKQETVSGSGISWAICKSAPSSRQITTPAPHHSVFTGRMPFLLPNQQHQSTEGKIFTAHFLRNISVKIITGWCSLKSQSAEQALFWGEHSVSSTAQMRKTTLSDTMIWLSSCILSTAAHSSASENSTPEWSASTWWRIWSIVSDCLCSCLNILNSDDLNDFSLFRTTT